MNWFSLLFLQIWHSIQYWRWYWISAQRCWPGKSNSDHQTKQSATKQQFRSQGVRKFPTQHDWWRLMAKKRHGWRWQLQTSLHQRMKTKNPFKKSQFFLFRFLKSHACFFNLKNNFRLWSVYFKNSPKKIRFKKFSVIMYRICFLSFSFLSPWWRLLFGFL